MWKVIVRKNVLTFEEGDIKRSEFKFELTFETSNEVAKFMDTFNAHSKEVVEFVVSFEEGSEEECSDC